MQLLMAFAILAAGLSAGAFLIMWNFRGRGFRELAFWRKRDAASTEAPGRPKSRY